jgi:hypothetical protein
MYGFTQLTTKTCIFVSVRRFDTQKIIYSMLCKVSELLREAISIFFSVFILQPLTN